MTLDGTVSWKMMATGWENVYAEETKEALRVLAKRSNPPLLQCTQTLYWDKINSLCLGCG